MTTKLLLNPYGVQICTNMHGVLLTYAINGVDHVEVCFDSPQQAMEALSTKSLDEVTGNALIGYAA
jgi:hypothetical protein